MASYNENTQKASEFFSYLFQVRDIAHLTHLYQPDKTLSTHKALNEFYDGLLDFTDELIESYQGIYGIVYIKIGETAPTNTPISFLKEVYNYIEVNRTIFKSSHIQNIIDEICSLTAKTLYLLQYVQ